MARIPECLSSFLIAHKLIGNLGRSMAAICFILESFSLSVEQMLLLSLFGIHDGACEKGTVHCNGS